MWHYMEYNYMCEIKVRIDNDLGKKYFMKLYFTTTSEYVNYYNKSCTENSKTNLLVNILDVHGRTQGEGARRGTCPPPPLEIKKYSGPPKDNLTRNFFF